MAEKSEKDKLFKTIRILLIMGVVVAALYFVVNNYREKQAARAKAEFLYELFNELSDNSSDFEW